MDMQEHLERHEALGDERDFLAAKPFYERALADTPTAQFLTDYGYLLACHGRNELRLAIEQYEQAIALDPTYDKPHFQLISARVALQEAELAVARYEERFASHPHEEREHRFLASAYLGAREYSKALALAEAGLNLWPGDGLLMMLRGEAKAGLKDADGALADWKRALELEPDDIGALYSTAFLLEREGRLQEAMRAWRAIIAWNDSRGFELQTRWPRHELKRIQTALADE
jgi:tetratricopeptide (TPR) repeat protein